MNLICEIYLFCTTIFFTEKRAMQYDFTKPYATIAVPVFFHANPDRFDLVITDMAMPNIPGDRLSVELIKICPAIPILLCSGFSEKMSEERAANLGIKGFLFKPIVMKDFAQKIREVLEEKIKLKQ